jgi:hypothetical protein
VLSEDTKSRPWLSKAIPTGLKQLFGHRVVSTFVTTSVAAFWAVASAAGCPFEKATLARL